jgi:hypothetical protein
VTCGGTGDGAGVPSAGRVLSDNGSAGVGGPTSRVAVDDSASTVTCGTGASGAAGDGTVEDWFDSRPEPDRVPAGPPPVPPPQAAKGPPTPAPKRDMRTPRRLLEAPIWSPAERAGAWRTMDLVRLMPRCRPTGAPIEGASGALGREIETPCVRNVQWCASHFGLRTCTMRWDTTQRRALVCGTGRRSLRIFTVSPARRACRMQSDVSAEAGGRKSQ